MLTGAERNSLVLTLGFLLLGSGIKLWKRAHTEIGPFPTPAAEASPAGVDRGMIPDPTQAAKALPADSTDADAADGMHGEIAAGEQDSAPAADGRGEAVSAGRAGDGRAGEEAGGSRRGGEARGSASRRKAPPAGKVDANRASAEELATIPGIGPATAAAIVAYRQERGAFRDLEQLREVKGIGAKKWAAIAPRMTVAAARGGTSGDTAGTGPETDGGGGIGGR